MDLKEAACCPPLPTLLALPPPHAGLVEQPLFIRLPFTCIACVNTPQDAAVAVAAALLPPTSCTSRSPCHILTAVWPLPLPARLLFPPHTTTPTTPTTPHFASHLGQLTSAPLANVPRHSWTVWTRICGRGDSTQTLTRVLARALPLATGRRGKAVVRRYRRTCRFDSSSCELNAAHTHTTDVLPACV